MTSSITFLVVALALALGLYQIFRALKLLKKPNLLKNHASGVYELPEEETVVEGNGLELFLLLLNLLKNAQRATEEAGASTPVRVRLLRTPEKIRLTVENDGRLLSEEEVAHLGTPFSTTSVDGLGLGLVIVQSIAEAHRAKLLYRARETGGLSVSLDFPPFTRDDSHNESTEPQGTQS
jgi:signal transduction histidine kinase